MDIDPFWSPAGRADARRYGIDFADVIAVIHAPTTIQVIVGDDASRLMFLGGTPGWVIVTTADRPHRNVAAYYITEVRPATAREAEIWEKRQK